VKAALVRAANDEDKVIPPTPLSGTAALHHVQLYDWACALEDEDCINQAKFWVEEWIKDSANPYVF